MTFVLPINSAINTYLYTIADVVSKYRKSAQDKTSDANKPKAGTSATSRSTEIAKTVRKSFSSTQDHQGETDANP